MKVFISFGQIHAHRVNGQTFDCDTLGVIHAKNEAEAREIAFRLFGDKWFTTYPEDSFNMDDMRYFPKGFKNVNNEDD